jgi:hypothetical protein
MAFIKILSKIAVLVYSLFIISFVGEVNAQVWENLPGHAKAIAVGGDSTDIVWSIGRNNSAYKWNESSFSWQTFGGGAQRKTVTNEGTPWVVNDGQIYRLRGQTWQNMPGQAVDIAAGGGTVWALGESGAAFKWSEDSFSWQDFGGGATSITVDSNGTPWVVNNKQIYRLRGQTWQNMPGQAVAIGAGGNEVWVVGESGAVYRWNDDAFSWSDLGGKVGAVDAGGTGTPYAIENNGTQVYRLRAWR